MSANDLQHALKRHVPPTAGAGRRRLRFLKNNSVMLLFWIALCVLLIVFHFRQQPAGAAPEVITLLPALTALTACWLWSARAWHRYQKNEVRDSYRMATECSIDGITILMAVNDRNGKTIDFLISDCNNRSALFHGVDAKTLIGMRLSEVTAAAYFPETMKTMRTALQTGYLEDELRGRDSHPDEPQWMHRQLARTGTGIAMTLRDISEKKSMNANCGGWPMKMV